MGKGLIAALLLLLLAVACAGPAAPATPEPEPTPIPDPAAILARAAERVAAADSLGFVLEHPTGSAPLSPGLRLIRAEGAANASERFRLSLELEASGSFLELEVIGIGAAAWMTNPLSGEWESAPAAALPGRWDKAGAVFAAALAGVESPELTGSESVAAADGSYAAWVIRGQLPGTAWAAALPGTLVEGSVPVTIWADQAERRLPKLLLEGPLVAGDLPEVSRVLTLEALQPPAEIAAPVGGG